MIKVYHSNKLCVPFEDEADQPKFPNDYKLVAEVATDDIEKAFVLTNNISHGWHENPEVKLVGEKARSTSYGDVVELNGEFYKCDLWGWEKFTPEKK